MRPVFWFAFTRRSNSVIPRGPRAGFFPPRFHSTTSTTTSSTAATTRSTVAPGGHALSPVTSWIAAASGFHDSARPSAGHIS